MLAQGSSTANTPTTPPTRIRSSHLEIPQTFMRSPGSGQQANGTQIEPPPANRPPTKVPRAIEGRQASVPSNREVTPAIEATPLTTSLGTDQVSLAQHSHKSPQAKLEDPQTVHPSAKSDNIEPPQVTINPTNAGVPLATDLQKEIIAPSTQKANTDAPNAGLSLQ